MSLRAEVRVPGRLEASLEAGPGITVVFGPSGAGKTTLLHAVLGSVRAEGTVTLGDRVLRDSTRGIDLPVHARRIGLVDQEALLFPHLDVSANAAFGARERDGRRRARLLLDRLGAGGLAHRRPATLSGGERRRVALARALAAAPEALLLDEPLTGLDQPAREGLGAALVAEQAAAGIPFLLVTHDAAEAFRLGHRLLLLESGRVVRAGPPSEVLPGLGTESFLSGTVVRSDPGEGIAEVDLGGVRVSTGPLPEPPGARVALGLRAEDVLVCRDPVSGTSARNLLAGTVVSVETRDGTVHATVATPVPIRTVLTPGSARALGIAPGARVHLLVKAQSFRRLL